jgi:hypothetical protein
MLAGVAARVPPVVSELEVALDLPPVGVLSALASLPDLQPMGVSAVAAIKPNRAVQSRANFDMRDANVAQRQGNRTSRVRARSLGLALRDRWASSDNDHSFAYVLEGLSPISCKKPFCKTRYSNSEHARNAAWP